MAQLQAKAAGGSELTRGEQADIVAPRVDVNSLVDFLRARQPSGAWAWRVLAMHHRCQAARVQQLHVAATRLRPVVANHASRRAGPRGRCRRCCRGSGRGLAAPVPVVQLGGASALPSSSPLLGARPRAIRTTVCSTPSTPSHPCSPCTWPLTPDAATCSALLSHRLEHPPLPRSRRRGSSSTASTHACSPAHAGDRPGSLLECLGLVPPPCMRDGGSACSHKRRGRCACGLPGCGRTRSGPEVKIS